MVSEVEVAGGRLTIDLGAIVANWRQLAKCSAPAECAAVVKADAYGLGVEQIVPALARAGCDTFFVALASEALSVKALAPEARVFALNGVHAEEVADVANSGVVPVLPDSDHIAMWLGQTGLPYALQVDTGMNRLGVSVDEAFELSKQDDHGVVHLMSHLACADQPSHPMNRRQIDSFQTIATAFDGIESSLSNSAATLWGGALGHTLTRPGIALYGGAAINDQPNPMQPVATLEGQIIHVRKANAGETVSYGATETLARDTTIATVSIGYADGYPRSASGTGVPMRDHAANGARGFIEGHYVPLLGRVSMDLTMFDVTDVPEPVLGHGWIELIGPNAPLDDLAQAAGTIGYELLTKLGHRYARRYLPVEWS